MIKNGRYNIKSAEIYCCTYFLYSDKMARSRILIQRFSVLILLLFCGFSANSQKFNIADIPLTWKDFTVRKDMVTHPYDAKIYTNANYESKFVKKGGNKFLIFRLSISLQRSWVKDNFISDASNEVKQLLLAHEKGHLMIALIRLKKAQNAISGLRYSKMTKAQIDSIFNLYFGDIDIENELYDKETAHSKILSTQNKWTDTLLNEINLLYAEDRKIQLTLSVSITADY